MRFQKSLLYCLLLINFTSHSQSIFFKEWTPLIPSSQLPSSIKCQHSNNNLDLIKFQEKYYLAFRTAPTHFASQKTKLYIISSADFKNWSFEKEICLNTDLREPRFVDYNNELYLYFMEGGTRMFKFQPKHIWRCQLTDHWREQVKTNLDGFVNWRLRVHDNKLYLSAYYGVDLYNAKHEGNLRLFTSTDGLDFTPISTSPQISTKGAEEGEFIFDKQGNLWAVVRLEGSGSYLCFASKDSIDKWTTKFSKLKYDSSLLFEYDNQIYLIARKHLKGNATETEHPTKSERFKNLIRYSFSKKVTALYKINREKMEIESIINFPSTGDNAFPAIAVKDENSFYVLNYSSDIHKRDKVWIVGQLGKTFIYQSEIHFQKKY